MKTPEPTTEPTPVLSHLGTVQLDSHHTAILEAALATCGGSRPWRLRKATEARELLALAQVSRRLLVLHLDLRVDIRAVLLMRVTVPCMPDPSGHLRIEETAHLGIVYREEALFLPQPGFSFVQLLGPQSVWHPNVSADPVQVLCLGTSLGPGLPVRELILLCYGALTMMSVQLDPANSAGVLNPAAADFFQRNTSLLPLLREPFLISKGAVP
jgi:hypothetical protein